MEDPVVICTTSTSILKVFYNKLDRLNKNSVLNHLPNTIAKVFVAFLSFLADGFSFLSLPQ